jgi:cytochrome c-type biogenesis protein CcmE
MTRKRRRLLAVALGLGLLGAATAMVLAAFNDNLVFFYGPSDLLAKAIPPGRRIRIGGLVEQHSLVREAESHGVGFRVTDGKTVIRVVYDGVLPDLFREGQGVVAEGRLRAFRHEGVWLTVNTPKDLRVANDYLAENPVWPGSSHG